MKYLAVFTLLCVAGCGNVLPNRAPQDEQYLKEIQMYRDWLSYPVKDRNSMFDPCFGWRGEHYDQCWATVVKSTKEESK